jgi:putative FmdB family regulatory protein
MPIYEYECGDCGKTSEYLIRNTSAIGALECPSCKSTNLKRVVSVPSIIHESEHESGHTCCGRTERCETPPCSSGGRCCSG